MTEVLAILLMSLIWAFFVGDLSAVNLFIGAFLGILVLSIVEREQERSFPRRLLAVLYFVYRFFVELWMAGITIVRLAISRRPSFHPHVISVPLRLKSDAAISLLAATITLLPGTVAMGVSEDKSRLYAHAIGAANPDEARGGVKRIEDLILGFMS